MSDNGGQKDFIFPFSEEIWFQTYKYHTDENLKDTQRRVAKDLASIEKDTEKHEEEFLDALEGFKVVPGGRITSNAGTGLKGASYINCFVGGPLGEDQDSIEGIFDALKDAALTLKSEGGYGFCVDFIRPRGSFINGVGVESPGAVEFLRLWDTMSSVITKGSGQKKKTKKGKNKIRKGAMMVTMSCWHPDIEEFIAIKQTGKNLEKFNMSLLCYDDFMDAVINGKSWELVYPDTTFEKYNSEWDGNLKVWKEKGYPVIVHKTYEKAEELWDQLMLSTYNRNEPGVLFVDRINRLNNLSYIEHISATNPCFSGDTLIAVADGRIAVPIKQLVDEGKDVPVYSINEIGATEVKWARNPRVTGYSEKLLRITIDDGSFLDVTPNHKFPMRNGGIKTAAELIKGDSLFRFRSSTVNIKEDIQNRMRKIQHENMIKKWKAFEKETDLETTWIDDRLYAVKYCECCQKKMTMPWPKREISYCSGSCASRNTYSQRREKGINRSEKNLHRQIMAYKDLVDELGREPYLKEWAAKCKSRGIPWRLRVGKKGRLAAEKNPFLLTSFRDLKERSGEYNHRVVSIEELPGEHTVYNLTVDDNHTVGIVTNQSDLTHTGIFVLNCGEQLLQNGGVCLLGSLNLVNFIDIEKNNWDYDKLEKYIPTFVRMLDNVNDKTIVPLPIQKWNLENKRRIGIGYVGYGSALYLLNKRYGSEEALKLTEELCSFVTNKAYQASAMLAKEKGAFPSYDEEKYLASEFIKQALWPETIEMIRKYGIRNSHLTSIQPTGNTSVYINNVSSGLEPVVSPEYYRTVVVPVPPEGLSVPTVDWAGNTFKSESDWKWAKEGDENILILEFEGKTYKFDHNRGLVKEELVEDYGVHMLRQEGKWDPEADWAANIFDLTIKEHVDTMKVFAKYIDAAMSKTINVPNDYPYDDFKDIYLDMYKSGVIKGGTTYRIGTMTNVISAEGTKAEEEAKGIQKNSAPKRPKKLPCDVHHLTVGGEKWVVFVGLFDGHPYEVFAGLMDKVSLSKKVSSGSLIKRKKGKYGFINEDIEIDDINEVFDNATQGAITRLASMSLRHGVDIKFVITQLLKTGNGLTTFAKCLARTLKKYVKEGEMLPDVTCESCESKKVAMIEGCHKCMSCGFSACS